MAYLGEVAQAIRREIPEALLPSGDVELLLLFYAVLALVKGEETSARDVHDAWVAWMTAADEDHPSMVPYDSLPERIRAEDEPFVAAIRRVARDQLPS